jgi:hypothetical protein
MVNRGVATTSMQSDGNLVSYAGPTPVWASQTHGNPGAFLVLGDDGSLTIFASGGSVIKTISRQRSVVPLVQPCVCMFQQLRNAAAKSFHLPSCKHCSGMAHREHASVLM